MKPKKSLGQNFLHDKKNLERIIAAGEINDNDTIVEVGAGKGALTEELVKHAKKVIALEIDRDLIPVLRSKFKNAKNLEIIHQDVLAFNPPSEPYKVIANIPYYITSPIIRHFLYDMVGDVLHHRRDAAPLRLLTRPTVMILMIQKDVAVKICSKEGSVLSLMVKLFADPEIVCTVPKTAFTPQPKVESAVIKIVTLPKPRVDCDTEKFLKLIKLAFAQPRKTLANNLANGFHKPRLEIEKILEELKLDPKIRAQKLSIKEWEALIGELKPVDEEKNIDRKKIMDEWPVFKTPGLKQFSAAELIKQDREE